MPPARRRTRLPCRIVAAPTPASYSLNVPNVYRVSINPSGSAALVFVQDSNLVYSVYKLQTNQKVPSNAVDCEPQNLPVYCVLPVPGTFDRPTKAVFSADGTTAFVLNCGPECGGNQASVSFLPVAGIIIQSGAPVPPGAPTAVTATVPVPGGTTDAMQNGNLLYLAGQQLQPDGFFAGFLSILDTGAQKITGNYSISDGTHLKMTVRATTIRFGWGPSFVPRANDIIRAPPPTLVASPCSTPRPIRSP